MSDSLHPVDCSLPGPSVHGILQARKLEWVAVPFSRGSSQFRVWTCISCTGRQIKLQQRVFSEVLQIITGKEANSRLAPVVLHTPDFFLVLKHLNEYQFLYNFKSYFSFTVTSKFWIYSPCCPIYPWTYVIPSGLYPPLSHPYSIPATLCLVSTGLFSIFVSLLLFCYIH